MKKDGYQYGVAAYKNGIEKDCTKDEVFMGKLYGEMYVEHKERLMGIEGWNRGWEDAKKDCS